MKSFETSDKIIITDDSGKIIEIPKKHARCGLGIIEVFTQTGKSSVTDIEGGILLGLKGKHGRSSEEIVGVKAIIVGVKAIYGCPYAKEAILETDGKIAILKKSLDY